jgi:hypothetical protein
MWFRLRADQPRLPDDAVLLERRLGLPTRRLSATRRAYTTTRCECWPSVRWRRRSSTGFDGAAGHDRSGRADPVCRRPAVAPGRLRRRAAALGSPHARAPAWERRAWRRARRSVRYARSGSQAGCAARGDPAAG